MAGYPDLLIDPVDSTGERALVIDGLPGAFVLHFQPEYDLRSKQITGCEALLRWSHPEYGLLRPGASLHHTKWSDALGEAEDWATAAVIDEVASWGSDGVNLQAALNLSARQLEDPGLPRSIAQALAASGADPRQLRVDVPVGAFTTKRLVVIETVRELDDSGVTIVADGVTGDPRAPLAGMPVGIVKINIHVGRRRNRDRLHPLVSSSIELAKDLGAISVAKAVRHTGDLDVLRLAGFDRAFGDVLSPALPASDLLDLLR